MALGDPIDVYAPIRQLGQQYNEQMQQQPLRIMQGMQAQNYAQEMQKNQLANQQAQAKQAEWAQIPTLPAQQQAKAKMLWATKWEPEKALTMQQEFSKNYIETASKYGQQAANVYAQSMGFDAPNINLERQAKTWTVEHPAVYNDKTVLGARKALGDNSLMPNQKYIIEGGLDEQGNSTGKRRASAMTPDVISKYYGEQDNYDPHTRITTKQRVLLEPGDVQYGLPMTLDAARITDMKDPKSTSASGLQAGEDAYKKEKDITARYDAVHKSRSNYGQLDKSINDAIKLRSAFNKSYNKKTGEYNVPPSMHTEIAMQIARLMSGSGTVSQKLIQELQQGTIREKMAKLAIEFGAPPEETGGSTQGVLRFFKHQVDRLGLDNEELRDTGLAGIKQDSYNYLTPEKADRLYKNNRGNSYKEYLNKFEATEKPVKGFKAPKVKLTPGASAVFNAFSMPSNSSVGGVQ